MLKIITTLTVLTLGASGCATITKGTKDALEVRSNPQEAKVQLSNGQSCTSTPCIFSLPRKEPVVVTISKEGCKTRQVNVISKISNTGGAAVAGNVIVGGVIGLGVDAATGAALELAPNPVEVDLSC